MKRLLALALFLSACATQKVSDVQPVSETKKFTEAVGSQPLSQAKVMGCTEAQGVLSKEWNLKNAMNAAAGCYKAKNLDALNKIAEEWASREPKSPWGPYWMAQLSFDAGQKERADWMIELAYTRGSESSSINYLRGQIQWMNEKNKQAVESFEKATELDPYLYPAQVFLGQIYFEDQEFSNSLERFQAALRSDGKNRDALFGYAECQLQLGQPQEAISTLNDLADRNPTDAQYLQRVAEIQQNNLQDTEGALKTYKRLQKILKNGQLKNLDPGFESKLKQLEAELNFRRSVASSKEKSK